MCKSEQSDWYLQRHKTFEQPDWYLKSEVWPWHHHAQHTYVQSPDPNFSRTRVGYKTNRLTDNTIPVWSAETQCANVVCWRGSVPNSNCCQWLQLLQYPEAWNVVTALITVINHSLAKQFITPSGVQWAKCCRPTSIRYLDWSSTLSD